jgi:hypothetical protein
VDHSVLQAAIDEAKTLNSASKPITHSDVVDQLRMAMKR